MEKPAEPKQLTSLDAFKHWLYVELEPNARHRPGLSALNKFVCSLIVISALFAVLETEHTLSDHYRQVFLVVEAAITAIFVVEYGLRVWVSSENPAYGPGFKGRLRYIRSPVAICDLLALAPAILALAGSEAFLLRTFRLLRILRVARLGRFSRASRYMTSAISSRKPELVLSVAIAGLLILASSTLLHLAEGHLQPTAFGSIPRAMWWSVSTLTTVGYGDVYPITPLGRFLAGITAIAGIGLIAMPAGILASAFSEAARREREEEEKELRGEWRPE